MAVVAAWILVVLGVGHTVVGWVSFKKPLAEAIRTGFVGQFVGHPDRLTAFWFMIFGPLLVMVGHMAVHAANAQIGRSLRSSVFICKPLAQWEVCPTDVAVLGGARVSANFHRRGVWLDLVIPSTAKRRRAIGSP